MSKGNGQRRARRGRDKEEGKPGGLGFRRCPHRNWLTWAQRRNSRCSSLSLFAQRSLIKLDLKATECIHCQVKFPQAFSDVIPILYLVFLPCRLTCLLKSTLIREHLRSLPGAWPTRTRRPASLPQGRTGWWAAEHDSRSQARWRERGSEDGHGATQRGRGRPPAQDGVPRTSGLASHGHRPWWAMTACKGTGARRSWRTLVGWRQKSAILSELQHTAPAPRSIARSVGSWRAHPQSLLLSPQETEEQGPCIQAKTEVKSMGSRCDTLRSARHKSGYEVILAKVPTSFRTSRMSPKCSVWLGVSKMERLKTF